MDDSSRSRFDVAREAFLDSTEPSRPAQHRIAAKLRDAPPPRRGRAWIVVLALLLVGVALVVGRLPRVAAEGPPPQVAKGPPPPEPMGIVGPPRVDEAPPSPAPSEPEARTGRPAPPPARADPYELSLRGEGTVAGTDDEPVVHWVSGTVSVRVDPEADVDLTVVTDEATVRVVGTVFDVHRDNHATTVTVSEGTVSVRCDGERSASVDAPHALRCLSSDPARLLLRTTALAEIGASAELRLETIERALDRTAETSALGGELMGQQVKALTDAGRTAAALEVGRRYLALGHLPRRSEILAFVARTGFDAVGCDALDDLERAVAEAPMRPEALLLAECLRRVDPARAREVLETAEPAATGRWRERASRLREFLSGEDP